MSDSIAADCGRNNQSNLKKKRPAPRGPRGRFGCRTCRQRHVRCDELRPVCENCSKAKRNCLWNHELNIQHHALSSSSPSFPTSAPGTTSTGALPLSHILNKQEHSPPAPLGLLPSPVCVDFRFDSSLLNQIRRNVHGEFLANITDCPWDPPQILKHRLEAALFRFYLEHAGLWLDITSPSRHFALTVPRLALSNPVLLFACLSYSAKAMPMPTCTLLRDGAAGWASLSEQYMSVCYKLLIPLLSDPLYVSNDETLLATLVILRHVEQYAEAPDDRRTHLKGALDVIMNQSLGLLREVDQDSLPGAALWTCMRQDVRQALLNRTSPQLKPSRGIRMNDLFRGSNGSAWTRESKIYPASHVSSCQWADRACHLAQMACILAWGDTDDNVDPHRLEDLLAAWEESLPQGFAPYHVSESGDMALYLGTWHVWAVAAWQFFHLARLLLKLYHPTSAFLRRPRREVDLFTFNEQLEEDVSNLALAICNISYSTRDVGCLFNASAMLGFVGMYLREESDQKRLIEFMHQFTRETTWPTQTDQERLYTAWRDKRERHGQQR